MCSYNITLSDTLVEKVRPSFADDNALQLWLQQQMEEILLDYYVTQLEAKILHRLLANTRKKKSCSASSKPLQKLKVA